MINIIVSIETSHEHCPKMLPLLEALTAASQQETGNVMYQYYMHPTDATRLTIVEIWENADVLAVHEHTEHFVVLLPQISAMASNLKIQKFEATPIE